MKKLLALCLVLSLNGCLALGVGSDDQRWAKTPQGTRVLLPDWLTDPALIEQALEEIDTTKPDADPRIDPGIVGAPVGIKIVIRDPGPYPMQSGQAPNGTATGHTDMLSYIHCAWRWLEGQTRLLPALGHEYQHCYTKDPWVGHKR